MDLTCRNHSSAYKCDWLKLSLGNMCSRNILVRPYCNKNNKYMIFPWRKNISFFKNNHIEFVQRNAAGLTASPS